MAAAFISIILAFIVHLPCLYLRYIPFAHLLEPGQKKRLFHAYGLCFFIYISFFLYWVSLNGVYTLTFMKMVLSFVWIPFVIINLSCIRGYFFQQIFVFGMSTIFFIATHTVSVNLFLCFLTQEEFFAWFPLYLFANLIITLLTLPIVKPFFTKLFYIHLEGVHHYFWRLICLVPCLFSAADVYYLNAAGENLIADAFLIPRILNIIVGFCLAASINAAMRLIDQYIKTSRQVDEVRRQQNAIRDYAESLEKSEAQMALIRHDQRHVLQLLSTCIENGETTEPLAIIRRLYNELDQTKVTRYCQSTLVNAVLSQFAEKAEKADIACTIDTPVQAHISLEMDFAVVLANLLENALHASELQPAGERDITIVTRDTGESLTVMVKNRFGGSVIFGPDGLPQTSRRGHGIGMKSVQEFCDHTGGSILCRHQDDYFTTYLHFPYTIVNP